MIAHIPTVTKTTSCMHFCCCFFWYTVRSPFSGSINSDSLFTGKWGERESSCGQLSERRDYCSLRQSNRTDGRPHPHPPLLESEHRTGQQKHRKETNTHTQRKADRQDREKRRKEEDRVKNSMTHKHTQKKQRKQKNRWKLRKAWSELQF